MTTFTNSVQIAGIRNFEEARLLIDAGVDYIGFPLRLDFHVEDLSEDATAQVVETLGCPERCVCITYEPDPDAVAGLCRNIGAAVVQLHGDMSRRAIMHLKAIAPGLTIIKSLVVGRHPKKSLDAQVRDLAPHVHAFLTDTFDPETGASGATGKPHDWTVSRRLATLSPRPVILAGGLTPDNVAEAIHTVRPAAVDAHTGVEDADGWKDKEKVEMFVQRAKRAFNSR